MACYVSSHGKIGTTIRDGLTAANSADPSFAAVAMEYRPEDAENKVRFFVFGEGGLSGKILYPPANTTDNAFYEFDTGKYLRISGQNAPGQPVPGVCLSCHGGTLNASTGVITDAHFLPFDTFALEFSNPSDRNQSTTNSAATKFNKLNTWVYRGELSAYPYATSTTAQVQIIDFLKGSYTPAPSTTPGSELAASAVMNDDYVDTRFTAELSTDADVTRAYKSVARPYCRGCHMAQNYEISFHDLAKACDPSKNMPHSETAAINLYRHHEFVQPIINKIAEFNSSTNCKKVFKLTNFESLYPSRDGLFSYFSSNGYLVPGPSSDSTFTASTSKIAKRSLRMTQSFGSSPLYFNSLPVGTPDKGQLLGLSFEYITPMAEDSISTSIGVVDSTSTNPNIPGYPFKLATDTFSPTSMASPWMSSQRTINPGGAMLEIDNILSEWDINTTSTIQRADYEDKSSGQLGLPTMSI
ncbi:MAG TPA: hypothetical protein PK129_16165, partial [Cellvibrionaceae bacterium]|nr:hypothetical protein [Cellvibrionaceae bacterium]